MYKTSLLILIMLNLVNFNLKTASKFIPIYGIEKIEQIGDKPIIIGVHGMAGYAGWTTRITPGKYDLSPFEWKWSKITRGVRDFEAIRAAKKLADRIIDIFENVKFRGIKEQKKIFPKIVIIGHSFGGLVATLATNLLNHRFRKKTEKNIFSEIIKTFEGIGEKIIKKTPTLAGNIKYEDSRWQKEGIIQKAKNIITRHYYKIAYDKIQKRIDRVGLTRITRPLIRTIYLIGTPNRNEFPFSLDMNIVNVVHNLYAENDTVQSTAGYVKIPETPFTFNFLIKLKNEDGQIVNPDHEQLVEKCVLEKLPKILSRKILKEYKKHKTTIIIFPKNIKENLEYKFVDKVIVTQPKTKPVAEFKF